MQVQVTLQGYATFGFHTSFYNMCSVLAYKYKPTVISGPTLSHSHFCRAFIKMLLLLLLLCCPQLLPWYEIKQAGKQIITSIRTSNKPERVGLLRVQDLLPVLLLGDLSYKKLRIRTHKSWDEGVLGCAKLKVELYLPGGAIKRFCRVIS